MPIPLLLLAAMGAAAGAGIGAATNKKNRGKSALKGALLGATLGTGAGALGFAQGGAAAGAGAAGTGAAPIASEVGKVAAEEATKEAAKETLLGQIGKGMKTQMINQLVGGVMGKGPQSTMTPTDFPAVGGGYNTGGNIMGNIGMSPLAFSGGQGQMQLELLRRLLAGGR